MPLDPWASKSRRAALAQIQHRYGGTVLRQQNRNAKSRLFIPQSYAFTAVV